VGQGNSLTASDESLQGVLVEVIESEERGERHALDHWLALHPDHSAALRSFFADRAAFDGILAHAPAPAPGTHLRYFGDYELIDEIARGGMGVIYRAKQANLDRVVALKMILGGRFSGPNELERFRNEAHAVGQLDHPGIVPLYEVGEHDGQHYFTMKLVTGGSLAEVLAKRRVTPRDAARLIAAVARAVHHAHQRGLLHRDLKPANILLESPDSLVPLVADFGLSKHVEVERSPTHTGAILGTPGYMAPEQARAEKQLTTACDVYSLGAIFYEMLVGVPPFRGATVADTLDQLQRCDAKPPRVDRDLDTICLKCLSKEPAGRYGSAEAVADDLDRWLAGTAILARPVGSIERAVKWARRRPAVAGLTASLAVSLLTSVIGMGVLLSHTRAAERAARDLATAESQERLRSQRAEAAAEQSLTFNRIAAAYRYWQDGNLTKTDELLAAVPAKYRHWEWNHLQKLLNPEESRIDGAYFVLTSDQKRMMVYGCNEVTLWDVVSWKPIKRVDTGSRQCRFSPDGSRYALIASQRDTKTGRVKLTIAVHDTESSQVVWQTDSLPIQACDVRTIAFSPDHSRIAVCGTQWDCLQGGDAASTMVVVDGNTGETCYTVKQAGIHAAFSPDGKTLAAFEERMDVWKEDAAPGEKMESGTIHWPSGKRMKIGERLCRRDSWIHLLDPTTGESLGKITHADAGGVWQNFVWSPDSRTIYALGRGTTYTYDVATRKPKAKLLGHKDAAIAIAFPANPNQIITGGVDHTIKLWDVAEGKVLREWKGHRRSVAALAVLDRGRTLLSAGDGTIRKWSMVQTPGTLDRPVTPEPTSGFQLMQYSDGGAVGAFHMSAGYSRDGSKTLACEFTPPTNVVQAIFGAIGSTTRCSVSLLDTKSQRPIHTFKSVWRTRSMYQGEMQLLFSPDDCYGAAYFHGQTALYDLKTGKEFLLPFRAGGGLSFSHDSKTLATVQDGTNGMVFDPERPIADVPDYVGPSTPSTAPSAVPAVLPADVASVPPPMIHMFPTTIVLWDTASRKPTGEIRLDQLECQGTAFSPDGRWLVAYGRGPFMPDGDKVHGGVVQIRLIDLATKKQVRVLKGSNMNHMRPSFSADGRLLTAASWDGNVYVWDCDTGKLTHTLRGHQGYVWSSCFSPDGRRIFSSGNDGTLKVWDAGTGEEIITLTDAGGRFDLAFDAAGELTGHGLSIYRTWPTAGR
jgi:WD40 repeat protein